MLKAELSIDFVCSNYYHTISPVITSEIEQVVIPLISGLSNLEFILTAQPQEFYLIILASGYLWTLLVHAGLIKRW
jgi:hypothetical protein